MATQSSQAARPATETGERVPMLIGGAYRYADSETEIVDPYRGDIVSRAPNSTAADLDDAIAAAVAAKDAVAAMPAYKRAEILRKVASLMAERRNAIAEVMTRETGKAIRDSRSEVDRAHDTVSLSAEEAVRIEGDHVPLDATAQGAGKLAMMLRFPVGVVGSITPFNAPFNLACHKAAPALAAGNASVLKPPPQAPLTVHKMVELFVDAGLPAGFLNVVYGNDVGPKLVRDPRIDFISFTGSTRVGAEIKAASGMKRVALELGGTGQTIVHSDADLEKAAEACARYATRIAGQSCISVQNVYAHADIYDRFVGLVRDEIAKVKMGDPLDEATDLGTLIDEAAAKRVEAWVKEAAAAGAKVLAGGGRKGAQIEPTLLVDVDVSMKVVCEEVFGPVLSIQRYEDIDTIFRLVSDLPLGLQCGIFTNSMPLTLRAIRSLRTGGVIVNGPSSWRTDQMPYGGIKNSGIGREGPRYAVQEMTDQRLVIFNL